MLCLYAREKLRSINHAASEVIASCLASKHIRYRFCLLPVTATVFACRFNDLTVTGRLLPLLPFTRAKTSVCTGAILWEATVQRGLRPPQPRCEVEGAVID